MVTSTSHYLRASNFGFTIPVDATINGIVVEIERAATVNDATKWVLDNIVSIVKADGTIGTTNKASATKWSTTEGYFTYGANNDLWGESWAYGDINDTDFGVVLSANVTMNAASGTTIANVDHIRITVYYTAAAGGTVVTGRVNIADTWSTIVWQQSMINIADTWEPVTTIKVNIGDAWKTVYP